MPPFALSLSKGACPRLGFDKLSPNGGEAQPERRWARPSIPQDERLLVSTEITHRRRETAAQPPRGVMRHRASTQSPPLTGDPAMNAALALDAGFELRFRSLFDEGRGLAFPCDATGC